MASEKIGHTAKDMLTGTILGFVCLVSLSWYLNLFAARGLSASKYETLVELEKALPLSPFTLEWEKHKAGKRDRMSFTRIELVRADRPRHLLFGGIDTRADGQQSDLVENGQGDRG